MTVHDTICRKVANRIPQLKEFARQHDVIIFVSGEKSSNGKQLFAVCREVNPRTYFVRSVAEVSPEMTEGVESVGISGATSTPAWLWRKSAGSWKTVNEKGLESLYVTALNDYKQKIKEIEINFIYYYYGKN